MCETFPFTDQQVKTTTNNVSKWQGKGDNLRFENATFHFI